jgi:diguanylate cyclase (GGDEF)-like protein/PAS domain S-box-containing protein
MNIDVQDALLLYSLLYFFGLLAILSIAKQHQNEYSRGYLFFSGFFLLSSIGALGIYFRGSLPIFISIIVANFILYLGLCSLLIAIYKFYNSKVPYKSIGGFSILYVLLFCLFTYIEPNFKARIIVFVASLIIICLAIYRLHSTKLKTYSPFKSIFGLMLIVFVIVNVWRLAMLLFANAAESFLEYNNDSLNIILTGIAGNMLSFGILSIINNEIFTDMKIVGYIFENSIKNAPNPIMIHDENGKVLNLSRNWTERSQYDKKDIPTIFDWTEKAYGKDKDKVREFIRKVYEMPKQRHDDEFIVTTKDGRKLAWDFNSGYIGTLPDGRRIGMSVAIDVTNRHEREKKINYLSYHDQLTGLYNRRFFEEEMKRLDNPRNLPISIIVGDVNGLKLVNDAFGHSIGDILLKTIGSSIQNNIRANDIAARWGGDEFVILLPNTNIIEAEKLIERIKTKINSTSFEYGSVSISFGVESKLKESDEMVTVFNQAEEIMYQNKLEEIDSIRGETINTIRNTLFEKSPEVKEHSERVAQIAVDIASNMGLSKVNINDIRTMGMIHDIGKIVIDLNILDKPGKLTEEEFNIIKKHPLSGSRMLSSSHEYTRLAAGVLHHHERIDGKGYPNGLTDNQIPIESKIIAVADAFDAMTATRPYRLKPLSIEQAINELKKNSNTQFDKKVVNVFITKVLKSKK